MTSALSRGQNYSDLESSKSEHSEMLNGKMYFPKACFAGNNSVDNWSEYIYHFPGLSVFFPCPKRSRKDLKLNFSDGPGNIFL